MQKLISLLTARYLMGSSYERSLSTVMIVCFLGITVGAGALTLVNAVMRGFEIAVHEKLQGIHADALIQSYGNNLNVEQIKTVISQEFPLVKAISPVYTGYALIESPDNTIAPTIGIIHGIDPASESHVSSLEKKLISQSSLSQAVHKNHVAIGKTMAHNNGLSLGMPFALHYMQEARTKNRISLDDSTVIVGGIFETGIDEYDATMIFVSPEFFHSIYPQEGVNQLKLRFAQNSNHQEIINQLKERLDLDVFSWKDLYPSLISALTLERYAMFAILILIMLVASMNIVALLFMFIQTKQADIAILHAMGMPLKSIKLLFVSISMALTITASLLGIGIASALCWLLNNYPFIELPDTYYVSHLPAHLEWNTVGIIMGVILLIALLATLIPLNRIRASAIAQVLRFEG